MAYIYKSIITFTIFSQIKKRGYIFRYREYNILFYKPVFSCQYMYCITFENVVLEKEDQLLSFSMACYKITINVIVWSGNVKRDDIKSYLKMIVMPSYPVSQRLLVGDAVYTGYQLGRDTNTGFHFDR